MTRKSVLYWVTVIACGIGYSTANSYFGWGLGIRDLHDAHPNVADVLMMLCCGYIGYEWGKTK